MSHSPAPSKGDVLQGLLCPICFHDLKTVSQLQEHFEQLHSADETDVLQTLKGFFGKAKRKILKQDNEFEDNKSFEESGSVLRSPWETLDYFADDQELGTTISHTKDFKEIRDVKIDRYSVETNKLRIRLDKLIHEAPEDPEKRKAHEQSIVHWIPDNDVRLCPGCAKSFGISRRRHHCRLCGSVMCQACSKFIDFHFACKLIGPTVSQSQPRLNHPSGLQRRGSNASLLSVVNLAGEPHIRACKDCWGFLIRYNQQIDDQSKRPPIVQKYERMREYMEEAEKLAPLYLKIIDSLSAGETSYHLRDAQELKVKLSKLAEGIDAISKTIAKLPNSEDEENSTKSVQLHSSIRMAALQFLRNSVLGLSGLPTEEEISRCRKVREQHIQKKIQLEKEAELMSIKSTSEKSTRADIKPIVNQKQETRNQVSLEDGWSASPGKIADEQENPMLQQMSIIRRYIKQARLDHKYDEVHILEANLKELQHEYLKEQQQVLPT